MVTSVQNPADIANLALGRVGYKLRTGNLYDGSDGSKQVLDLFGQTRDAVLQEQNPDFAKREEALTLLKTAPSNYAAVTWDRTQYPPPGWMFEYSYPENCIEIRSLQNTQVFYPNFDPQPAVFQLYNDNAYTPSRKTVLSQIPNALAVFTGRVTDPAHWNPLFVETFVEALARRLAPELANLEVEKIQTGQEVMAAAKSEVERG